MTPNIDNAAKVIRKIFLNSRAYSEKQVEEIVFHLTDCAEDLRMFCEFLEDPEKHQDDNTMQMIIRFLVHVPNHLNQAAELVLKPND
jgi:hypothetical protein